MERQDRLLLMVTDRLVDTIEELKLAYAAKDSSTTNDSTSTTSTASTPTLCCACTARIDETAHSGNEEIDVKNKPSYSVVRTVTPVTQPYEIKNKSNYNDARGSLGKPQPVTAGSQSCELNNKSQDTAKVGLSRPQSFTTERREQKYLETDIDAVPYKREQQEWTVTLTDGMGKSRAAKSVNQRIERDTQI